MKPGKNGRKENKETNTHTPMPRHAQKKKTKQKTNQEQKKEKQYCPRSERLNQPHSKSPRTGSWLSQLGINTRNIASMN